MRNLNMSPTTLPEKLADVAIVIFKRYLSDDPGMDVRAALTCAFSRMYHEIALHMLEQIQREDKSMSEDQSSTEALGKTTSPPQ